MLFIDYVAPGLIVVGGVLEVFGLAGIFSDQLKRAAKPLWYRLPFTGKAATETLYVDGASGGSVGGGSLRHVRNPDPEDPIAVFKHFTCEILAIRKEVDRLDTRLVAELAKIREALEASERTLKLRLRREVGSVRATPGQATAVVVGAAALTLGSVLSAFG